MPDLLGFVSTADLPDVWINEVEYNDPGSDDDSIIWTHYANEGLEATVGTIAVAASAAATALDSGVTLTFDEEDFCDDGDVFIFHISDSLHYNKAVTYLMRAGLNLHRR